MEFEASKLFQLKMRQHQWIAVKAKLTGTWNILEDYDHLHGSPKLLVSIVRDIFFAHIFSDIFHVQTLYLYYQCCTIVYYKARLHCILTTFLV